MSVAQQRLLSPEEIAGQTPSRIPRALLPDAGDVFARRAARLRALADGHAAGPYLAFVARIAERQQQALEAAGPLPRRDLAGVERARDHGFPPVALASEPLSAEWRGVLRAIVSGVEPQLPPQARPVLRRLLEAPDALLDQQAQRLLNGTALGLDTASAPFIGAALQVHATRRALALPAGVLEGSAPTSLCPCCGSPPVASVVRIGGDAAGLRYLQCSLCSTQWHMVRIKCARCQSTKGISYYALDDAGAHVDEPTGNAPRHGHPVMAEACTECGSYTKIVYMDRDPAVDACADDLATLTLDLLMDEREFLRWGVNFMLLHGDPDEAESAAPPASDSAGLREASP